jgi:putative mRNA 3-end processing factor
VIVTHGSVEPMVRWLREQGLEAGAFATEYGDDAIEADAAAASEGEPAMRAGVSTPGVSTPDVSTPETS